MVAVFVVEGQNCRFLNAVAEVVTGFSLTQSRGSSIGALLWRDNPLPFVDSTLGRTLSSAAGGEGEETIRTADGTDRRFGFRIVPLDPAGGNLAVVELVDLSGETGTARALRESEQRFRLAVEATGIGIWDVNAVTGVRRWSPEFFKILGLPADLMADNALFSALIHPDDRDWVLAAYERAYTSPAMAAIGAEFRILRASDGAERWVSTHGRVSYDAAGRAIRGVGTLRDIHARQRGEQALRESEERLRIALVAGRMGTWRYELATGEQQWDEMQHQLLGVDRSTTPSRALFLSLVHPDDVDSVGFDATALPAAGSFLDSEFRIVTPDRATRWISSSALVRYDSGGKPFEMIGVNSDITERKEAEEALRLSEERQRLAVETNAVGTWDYDLVTGEQSWSGQFKRLWGLPEDANSDVKLLRPLVTPTDWATFDLLWKEALKAEGRGRIAMDFRFQRADDGRQRWCTLAGQVFFDAQHRKPLRALGIMIDITASKAAELRQRLVLREMNHRVKNSLAVVQAIVSQTLHMTPDPKEAFQRIQSRLMSVARTHDFLNKDDWTGASLRNLIAGELEPFSTPGRIEMVGEVVLLDSSSTLALGLVFHELAANAVKHGALSVPSGTVKIKWTVKAETPLPVVHLVWEELGAPPVLRPATAGFGSRLIEASVKGTLQGTIQLEYRAGGLRCRLTFPLRSPASDETLPEDVPAAQPAAAPVAP
jgi:PAS domain S-box-containing protein